MAACLPSRHLVAAALMLISMAAAARPAQPAPAPPAAAPADGAAAARPVASGSATAVLSMPSLPATIEQLCAGVNVTGPQLPAGFSRDSLGPLRRLNTSTASWGYFRFGAAASPRPPLVLLTGLGATMAVWPLDFLAQLAADQQVIVVDNRGQGFTQLVHVREKCASVNARLVGVQDLAPEEPLSIPGLANETMEFIRALELAQPPNILGWSMGGMLAAALAALHGGELGKFVVLAGSAGGRTATPPTDAAVQLFNAGANRTDVQSLSAAFSLDTPGGVRAACEYAAAQATAIQSPRNSSTTTRQLYALIDYLLSDSTVWDALPAVANPVLLVAGGRDQTVPAANSLAMAQRLQDPWLVVYGDATHGAFLQYRSSFLAVLDAFLSGA